ncbi:unnamed protein product [Brassica oleracea var. botrytis]
MGYPRAPMRLHTRHAKRSTTNRILFNTEPVTIDKPPIKTTTHRNTVPKRNMSQRRQQSTSKPRSHTPLYHPHGFSAQQLHCQPTAQISSSTASTQTNLDFSSTVEELLTKAGERHLSQRRQKPDAGEANRKKSLSMARANSTNSRFNTTNRCAASTSLTYGCFHGRCFQTKCLG